MPTSPVVVVQEEMKRELGDSSDVTDTEEEGDDLALGQRQAPMDEESKQDA